jgi:hypothetical protein
MNIINDVQQKVREFASENASTLLTAGGVVGTVATAVLSGRAGYKSAQILAEAERTPVSDKEEPHMMRGRPPLTKTEKLIKVGPQFIPPVITGGATITAIVMSHRMSTAKAAALAAAYGLAQGQFEEYKEKVATKLTGPKQAQVNEELAQERVARNEGGKTVFVGSGNVLCFDQPSGRYFESTMEKIRQAANQVNEECIHHDHAAAQMFYDELGLPKSEWADHVGFNAENLIELEFDTILHPDDNSTPVLTINFKRLPTVDYEKNFREY